MPGAKERVDMYFEEGGLGGNLNNLVGMGSWIATAADCLDMKDIRNIATIEADDLELEESGSDYDSDCDSADGVDQKHVFLRWRT
jgi:hypothetical protein